jgi:SAM-dependent methyltransferase
MDWHVRYTQQASWTRDLRAYLFDRAQVKSARRILEVGCGTGAILRELVTPAALHGLDLEAASLTQCGINAPAASRLRADALRLPYPAASFDIVYCHFLLLWVRDPLQAVREMKRVARPGGHILALAEPDYIARVDEPSALAPLGRWQAESLRRQGADPGFGARLAETFFQAGIPLVETGTIQSRGKEALTPAERDLEWAVLESDLAGFVPDADLQKMKALDGQAWASGARVLNVPTYFAWGRA